MKNKLIGALIGLARATDGNEHLITESTTAVIIGALSAIEADNSLEPWLHQVEKEKRKMVPNCFFCANPCGRTDAYDMILLETAPEDVRNLKQELLSGILRMAVSRKRKPATDRFFYTALIFIGMDGFGPEALKPIVDEMYSLL